MSPQHPRMCRSHRNPDRFAARGVPDHERIVLAADEETVSRRWVFRRARLLVEAAQLHPFEPGIGEVKRGGGEEGTGEQRDCDGAEAKPR